MAPSQPLSSRARSASSSGFTLVEVALAIGIVAFAFVTLLALVPAGSTAFRRAIDISTCGQIAQRVINDAQMADFEALVDAQELSGSEGPGFTFRAPRVTKSALRYFDDQGREIIPQSGDVPSKEQRIHVVYEVNTRIMPKAPIPVDKRMPQQTFVDPKHRARQPLAQVTVQIAHNPNGIAIPFSSADASDENEPMRNLWKPTPAQAGIEIITYSALVGRNE